MNAFTHAPRLLSNRLLAAWQPLAWLLFHPSAWRNLLAGWDQRLPPYVALSELSRRTLWSRGWLTLLGRGYLLCPLLVWLAVVAVLALSGRLGVGALSGLATGLLLGVVFGLMVSVAAGLLVVVAATAAFTFLLGRADTLLIDVFLTPGIGLAFGAVAGIAAYALITTEDPRGGGQRGGRSRQQRLGGVLIGAVASLVGVVIVSVASLAGVAAWQNGLVGMQGVTLVTGLIPALLFSASIGLRTRSLRRALAYGAVLGGLIGLLYLAQLGNVAYNQHIGGARLVFPFVIVLATAELILFVFPFALAERVAGPTAGAVAGMLAAQTLHPIMGFVLPPYNWLPNLIGGSSATLVLLALGWWRPLLSLPFQAAWHVVLYRLDTQATDRPAAEPARPVTATRLARHAAFWDEQQWLPLVGLDDHLVFALENHPQEGQAAVEFLNAGHQRWAMLAAQIEMDARHLERITSVADIAKATHYLGAGQFEGPASALLRTFGRLGQDVAAALRQRSAFNQRLALRAVADKLDSLQRELTRSDERYAARYRPVAVRWQQIVAVYSQELSAAVERRKEIDNPYVIGVPLTPQQEVFVGRTDIGQRIEDFLLDRRRPPLMLYGQRRMGKTSLLNNLGRLLPNAILPLFVDLQGHVSYTTDHAGFFYNVARAMAGSAEQQRGFVIPHYDRAAFLADPLTTFDEWLDHVEATVRRAGYHTVLLSLDEFEALDSALVMGSLSEAAILGSLRHIIQHRAAFKVLLAGSHTIQEFQRWSSYFINAQIIHIDYLTEEEARQLIERPTKTFPLRYEPEAVNRILELTRGHPFLLQLLCSEIVILKNEQEAARRLFGTVADVEAAVPTALEVGSMYFFDIQQNQVTVVGRQILRLLAGRGEQGLLTEATLFAAFPDRPATQEALERLLRRELIEPTPGGYRFVVELIRRWFVGEG